MVNNESKANLLNQDNGKQPKFERQVSSDVNIDTVEFSAQKIYNVLRKLKAKTSSGPDGIPCDVLKKLGSSLAAPLAMMFEVFMSVLMTGDQLWSRRCSRKVCLPSAETTGLFPLQVSSARLWKR